MCGIAGLYTPGHPVDPTLLRAVVAELIHRGPDGDGYWIDGDVGLGMRRLAIVDVEHGDQPLANEDGSIQVVFNGEIYNHRELRSGLTGHRISSETDGEVIPHLYEEHGPDFVERLDGIFAFALWDASKRRIMLARDQLGVKPLYLHRHGGSVRFASELKALLRNPEVPRRLDLAAVDRFLTFRFTPAPQTLLAGVEKLAPATYLVCEGGDWRERRYWDPVPKERFDLDLDEATAAYLQELRRAVRAQMMSDRPIGAMLSGGVDSAAVVALMAERSSRVKTFTIGFAGGGDADETALARQTADFFGTDHHEAIIEPGDFRDDLVQTIAMLEEPVGTSSALGFRAVSALARPHVPVLLSGQGADELLGGYWRYVGEWIAGRVARLTGSQSGRALELMARLGPLRLQRGVGALRHVETLARFMSIYAVFTEHDKEKLYRGEMRAHFATKGEGDTAEVVDRYRRRAASRDSLAQMMFVDTRLWLPDDLLLVGDKMSMAESVEMRVPFLDRGLVEFVESLPTRFKVARGRRKVVHKRAMENLVPRAVIHRKERGFATPIDRWLRTDLHDYAREVLLDPAGLCASLAEPAYVRMLLDEHRDGRRDYTRQLFCLLSLELWGRTFLTVPDRSIVGAA